MLNLIPMFRLRFLPWLAYFGELFGFFLGGFHLVSAGGVQPIWLKRQKYVSLADSLVNQAASQDEAPQALWLAEAKLHQAKSC